MENLELDQLSPNEAAILRAIGREGRVLTSIKELACGDGESLHFPATVVSHDDAADNQTALSDDDVLRGLHSLERGTVDCSLTVHRVSTTEYSCEWGNRRGSQHPTHARHGRKCRRDSSGVPRGSARLRVERRR